MTDTNVDRRQLSMTLRGIACAPQAQRRYVQVGGMRESFDRLHGQCESLDALVQAGELSESLAAKLRKLSTAIVVAMDANPDFLEEGATGTREFLYSHALENPQWHEIRHLARDCYGELVGPDTAVERTKRKTSSAARIEAAQVPVLG